MKTEFTSQKAVGWGRSDPTDAAKPHDGFGIRRIGLVILTVRDPQKALQFFHETLGMQIRSMTPGWVELDAGGVILALHPHDVKHAAKEGELPSVVFDVDDVDEAFALLKERGVKFVSDPRVVHETPFAIGKAATFLDPDQNVLAIYGTVEKQPRVL